MKIDSARLAPLICIISLSGCSYYTDKLLRTPAPSEVADYATSTGAVTVSAFNNDGDYVRRQMYSSEYLLASVTYTNQKCDEFFESLAHLQQDQGLIDKVLTASIAAATPLMAAYGVGANAIAATAASVAFASNVNKFTSEIYAFAPYAGQLQRHVRDQMALQLATFATLWNRGRLDTAKCGGGASGGCYNEFERMLAVRGYAQAYANICSVSNFRAIIDSSLAKTSPECTTTTVKGAEVVGAPSSCTSVAK